jgi:hypothetical protein
MKFMLHLNNLLLLCLALLTLLSCEDKKETPVIDPEPCSYSCENKPNMVCVEGQCLCPEERFFTPWQYRDELCHDLTDSFYVRVGHEGDIEYFAPMDVLKIPSDSPTYTFSSSSISKEYPAQFIVGLFTSRSDTIDYDRYPSPQFDLVFDNNNPSNGDFPISGQSELDPQGYYPQGFERRYGLNSFYGMQFFWEVEYNADSATLHVDVYSSRDGAIFLDDEITMYFERYR